MPNQENEILDLLLSDQPINNERTHALFLNYLKDMRDTAPPTTEPMSRVFNIVIQYFKPEGINIESLDPKEQVNMTLYMLSLANKDITREEYQRILAGLQKSGMDTEELLQNTEKELNQFEIDVEAAIELEEARGGVFPPITGSPHTVSQVVFEFEIKPNKLPNQPDIFVWKIRDPLLGEKIGKIPMDTIPDLDAEKTDIVTKYMTNERFDLIEQKHTQYKRDIKHLDVRGKNIAREEKTTASNKDNYENFKKVMADTHSAKKRDTVTDLREKLRKDITPIEKL